MGLDAFKTENQTSSTSKKRDNGSPGEYVIHVADSVDAELVNIPGHIKRHSAEYIEIVDPEKHEDGKAICACMNCNFVATSYEAMVKTDHLRLDESTWLDEFKEVAIEQAPENPASKNIEVDDEGNSESDDGASGLDAFIS